MDSSYTVNTNSDDDEPNGISTAISVISQFLLFFLVFGMSATVDIGSMKVQIRNRRAILTGIALQFVLLPFFGFITVKMLSMPPSSGIALLVVTSSPGGSYSNWWCSLFNAELALSIAMTTVSTILSIFFLPLNLVIYASTTYSGQTNEEGKTILGSLDFVALAVSMSVVVGAIGLGLIGSAMSGSSNKFRKWANIFGNISGILFILCSALVSMFGDGTESESSKGPNPFEGTPEELIALYIGTAIPCFLGLTMANLLTTYVVPLCPPERVTCSVECTYQNTAISIAFCMSMFNGDELQQALRIPLYYSVLEAVVLGLYLLVAWKIGWTKAPRDEKFCVMLAKSYEVTNENNSPTTENDDEFSDGDAKNTKHDDSDNKKEIECVMLQENNANGCNDSKIATNDLEACLIAESSKTIDHENRKDIIDVELSDADAKNVKHDDFDDKKEVECVTLQENNTNGCNESKITTNDTEACLTAESNRTIEREDENLKDGKDVK